MEAAADNLILCGEGSIAQLRHEAANTRQDQVNSERARLARARRITAALSGQAPEGVLAAIRHKQVYVFNECMNENLASSLETACLVQGDDMATADVFVMKNPGYGQAGAMLVSALKGCYQISPGLLLSKAHAVKFKPRMLQPRILFASKKFANKYREFCNLVDRTLAADPAAECKMKFEISPNDDDSRPDSQWEDLKGKFKKKQPSYLHSFCRQRCKMQPSLNGSIPTQSIRSSSNLHL